VFYIQDAHGLGTFPKCELSNLSFALSYCLILDHSFLRVSPPHISSIKVHGQHIYHEKCKTIATAFKVGVAFSKIGIGRHGKTSIYPQSRS
jgi:hypothetical protein